MEDEDNLIEEEIVIDESKLPKLDDKPVSAKEQKNPYYINSKVFLKQLGDYYESNEMTNDLGSNLQKIAEGLSYNWRFSGYTTSWREEMIGDAIIKMYMALEKKSYRLDSGFNPFSYFNAIAWNAFSNRIKREKRQHDGLKDYKEMVYMDCMSDPNSQGHVYVRPIMDSDENDCGYGDE